MARTFESDIAETLGKLPDVLSKYSRDKDLLARYGKSKDPLERRIADILKASPFELVASGYPRRVLSDFVINPMGYRPSETGWYGGPLYGWGELAAIYQTTPAADVARRIEQWRSAGDPVKGDIAELLYGATRRAPEPGTGQTGQYPLATGGLSVYYPQLRTGQEDVKLDPTLVARLQTQIPMQRAEKRRYKGGTRISGVLSSIQLGKNRLGA